MHDHLPNVGPSLYSILIYIYIELTHMKFISNVCLKGVLQYIWLPCDYEATLAWIDQLRPLWEADSIV